VLGGLLKVCIVHDWLVTYAGAEKVLEQMVNCFPEADLFSLVDFLADSHRRFIKNKTVSTSFIQKMPFAKTKYRSYLMLMPLAIEQFDLSQYDLVISSSHAVAKGVLTGPDQLHICMCYSPIRYAWDLQHQYLMASGLERGVKSLMARILLHRIRNWDYRTANGVDHFVAISEFIQRRIFKTYRRESAVIYPPVDTERFSKSGAVRKDFYVTCSRLVTYKRIDLIVQAFTNNLPDKQLIVIGDGPDYAKINDLAGENVTLVGSVSSEDLYSYLSEARAFIFAAEEDFGIAPIEAQSCGTPVIAYGKGGALETIAGLTATEPTGTFFSEQTTESLANAVLDFEANEQLIDSDLCVKNANRFSVDRFCREFSDFVEARYLEHKGNI